ncbi:MAG: HAMP domain-containing protein [Thiobacillus sp.]|nr:HAMP domain-containing protein [Thiobacillus sp.]
MRLSIRHKLFLTLLAATTLVVAVMYAFMHWSFQHGFVSFLESRQQARAERMAEQLAEIYASEGGWDGVLNDRMRWLRLMADGRPMHGPGMGMGPGRGMGPGPRGLDGGLALLDADKRVLAGHVHDAADLNLSPIRVDGRVVGYVARPPGRALSELVDVRFAEAQRRAFFWIALLVGLVAVALSWPLANTLVRPLRRVTEATRELAAGRFQARVPARSGDELGDLARDFNELAQALERTESARRQWMADISHELRTPISLLKAELEAMQDGVRPLEPAAVASLQADVERLNRLVEDLYQLSMTDLGAMSYRKRPVDPVALLRDDVESLAGEFERRGLAIEMRADPALAVTLHADPDRLSQLFRNLMQNSLRYTDAGGRLVIAAGLANGRFRLDFDDSAPAVPDDALAKLFERFYRVEASRNRSSGGAGLGLAICRNIVEAHGGRIEARPSPLGGLGIHIELPVAP